MTLKDKIESYIIKRKRWSQIVLSSNDIPGEKSPKKTVSVIRVNKKNYKAVEFNNSYQHIIH